MYNAKLSGRKAQAFETRRKLLDTASVLFAKNGYAATSVRDIHRAANLADGILYHYFPSGKQELFHAIIEDKIKQIVSDTTDKSQDFTNSSLEEVLEEIYQIWLRLLGEYYDIFRMMFCENEVREVVDAEELSHILAARQPWFSQLLRARVATGEIRKIDPDFTSEMIFKIMFDEIIVKVSNIRTCWLDDSRMRRSFFHALTESWKI